MLAEWILQDARLLCYFLCTPASLPLPGQPFSYDVVTIMFATHEMPQVLDLLVVVCMHMYRHGYMYVYRQEIYEQRNE